jgi:hypothetical protein
MTNPNPNPNPEEYVALAGEIGFSHNLIDQGRVVMTRVQAQLKVCYNP